MAYMQARRRDRDLKKIILDSAGEGEVGMI